MGRFRSTERQLHRAERDLAQGRCPKCGAVPAHFDPDHACPECGVYPRKYLGMLNRKLGAEQQHARQRERVERLRGSWDRMRPKDFLPEEITQGLKVFLGVRWLFVGVGLWLFLVGGYSVFNLPPYAILYDWEPVFVRCPQIGAGSSPEAIARALHRFGLYEAAERCVTTGQCAIQCPARYRLTIQNAGRRRQPQILVHLDRRLVERSNPDPYFLDFGRFPRQVYRMDQGDTATYAIGPLNPMDRVVMHAILMIDPREQAPTWEQFFQGIEVAEGEVHQGPIFLSLFTRFVLQTLSISNVFEVIDWIEDRFAEGESTPEIAPWIDKEHAVPIPAEHLRQRFR